MEPEDVTHFASPADFGAWLAKNVEKRDELWVGYWRKATGRPSLTWEESVDEALCFGWIDGIRKRVDDEAYTIRFTPRRHGSTWSLRNIDRYQALQAGGRVDAAGRAAYERRIEEKSGVYSFEQAAPPGLPQKYVTRLAANERAWADWQSRPPGYRKQVTHWIMSAKREETRERRFLALQTSSEANLKVKPFR